jgi:peptidoglycan/xylan/chitin deacetylase (PgdA/CDA1 family)
MAIHNKDRCRSFILNYWKSGIILSALLYGNSIININAQKLTTTSYGFFYRISPVYQFKQSIVTLSFDDSYLNQFKVGIPILKEHGLPATFYVITGTIDSSTKKLIDDNITGDFEIGSHSVSHPDLEKVPFDEVRRQMLDSKIFLKENFGPYAALTFCYPYGSYNNGIKQLAKEYYMAARSTDVGYNSLIYWDRYALKMQGFDKNTELSQANQWIDFSIKNHLWLIEMIHGIDGNGYSPIDSKTLSAHLDYIKQNEDNVWCATVSNVIKYFIESEASRVFCDECTDTVYNIRVNDFLDDSVYNQPLSVRIKVPTDWQNIVVSDTNNTKIDYNISDYFVLLNVLPDNKEWIIRPGTTTVSNNKSGIELVFLGPNPFTRNIKISLETFNAQDINAYLFNLDGKLVLHEGAKSVTGIINFTFYTASIPDGLYILKVEGSRGERIIKKLVKIQLQ